MKFLKTLYDIIKYKNIEIGKILIDKPYSFALDLKVIDTTDGNEYLNEFIIIARFNTSSTLGVKKCNKI